MAAFFWRPLAAVVAIVVYVAGPARGQEPTREDSAAAIAVAQGHLRLLNEAKYAEAYENFGDGLREMMSLSKFEELSGAARAREGQFSSIKYTRAMWYPRPGGVFFVGLDFHGRTDKMVNFCGYFVMKTVLDGAYMIQRTEVNYLNPDLLAQMDAAQREQMVSIPGCEPFR